MCTRPGGYHLRPPLPPTMPADLLGTPPLGDMVKRMRTKKPEEPGSHSGWDSIHTQVQCFLEMQRGKETEIVNVISFYI